MRPLLLFDDGAPAPATLAPLTDLRPVFDVRVGALTVLERVALSWGRPPAAVVVPAELEAITRERHPELAVNPPSPHVPADPLLINARWIDCIYRPMLESLAPGEAVVGKNGAGEDGALLAASPRAGDVERLIRGDLSGYRRQSSPEQVLPRVLSRPWHVRSLRDAALSRDLGLLLAARTQRGTSELPPQPHVWVDPTASVHPSAVLDGEGGHIVIDAHAVVRPGAVVIGPAYIGPRSVVLEHATIRGGTAIGPWCKVGGEVSGTTFQGWSNKAHEGYLGDSWVGEWVNLGAGTTNSNLLNTYGEVTACAVPGGRSERTGEQFLGAIIGDHVKTAICTRIMTGAVIHTGAMLAQSAPAAGCIAPFAWMTDGGVRRYRAEKFEQVVRAAMSRRGQSPSQAYLERVRRLLGAGSGQGGEA